MYSRRVIAILVCMVVTGAARSVVIKLFYQFALEKPIFVTLLYLLSQTLSLFGYAVSTTRGLTEESREAVQWVHSIRYYARPLIPAVLNLLKNAMRSASMVHLPASVAEMMISGLGLVLSAAASWIIRKRMISCTRWIGIGIVSSGVLIIGGAELLSSDKTNGDGSGNERDQWIGLVLILGQCIISVFQDLSEELLIQDAEFSATLLLGLEGLFGLVIGSCIYFPLASKLGEPLAETMESLSTWGVLEFTIGLVCLFLVSGIFNILAIAETCSMTLNLWKNFRTILVWVFGLIIFYSSQNENLGEEWTPESFILLFGFFVMLGGAYLFYMKTIAVNEPQASNVANTPPFAPDNKDLEQGTETGNTLWHHGEGANVNR
jgi:drug/metabolite transporter (DMT)-like permease